MVNVELPERALVNSLLRRGAGAVGDRLHRPVDLVMFRHRVLQRVLH